MDVVMRVCHAQARKFPEFPSLGRDDMVSAALEKLVRSSHQFHAGDMALVAVIARRAIVDELRRAKLSSRHFKMVEDENGVMQKVWDNTEIPVSLDRLNDSEHNLLDVLGEEDDYGDLNHILQPLGERERLAVTRLVEGFSMVEIGEELGITESRVSQIISQARNVIELWQLDCERNRNTPGLRRRRARGHGRGTKAFDKFRDSQDPYKAYPWKAGDR